MKHKEIQNIIKEEFKKVYFIIEESNSIFRKKHKNISKLNTPTEIRDFLKKELSNIIDDIKITTDDAMFTTFKLNTHYPEEEKIIGLVNDKLKKLSDFMRGELNLIELKPDENYMLIRHSKY